MRPHRKPTAKFLMTFLSLIAMLLLAACGGSNGTPKTTGGKPVKAPDSQQVYRSPLSGSDINTFDPGQATDLGSIASIDMVFTGLVQLNDQLQVTPQLAHDYTVSADGLSWTFHLRSGLKFSDGTPLTSKDVAYSIDRALSPEISALNGVSLLYLGLIKGADERVNGKIPTVIGTGIQTPDDNTVIINVTRRTAYFLQTLTYSTSYVVEKSVIDKWGLKWTDHLADNGGQGGDGPFKVAKYDHNTGITFAPNPNYYGAQPQLKRVEFPFVKDENTNYLEYQANQLDNTSIPTANVRQAQALTDQFHQVPQLWINYFGLNYLVKPLDNIKIRQALELAINKDVIVKSVWGGQPTPTNHIIPKGMPGYDPGLTGPAGVAATRGDPVKAKALFNQGLQEEGLTLATFPTLHFTFSNTSKDTANEITTVIQMWQQVLGITSIKPDPVDKNKLFQSITNTTNNSSLQIWRVDWIADYPDPQDWITLQFSKGASDNNINYGQNQSTDATTQQSTQDQMLQADAMLDQGPRMQAYNQIEQQLVNDVAWLPMEQVNATYLLKPYVIGVVDNAQNLTPPDDWGKIYIAAH
ncbi:MAG TPA: peptide ABC transporter substrate-binding protein [Ktedonobacteraceae bacterium]|nr:peptide ABC transporter substrate-binding protein [Ktedonobacteraceae bacterium]